jgi:hypothetical protein
MPIAIPPPDIDPTVMPPASTQPSETETMENGIAAAEERPGPDLTQSRDSIAAGLTMVWAEPNPRAR